MSKWTVQAAPHNTGLIDLLLAPIRGGLLLNIYESPSPVLNEASQANTSKSYMWVYRGGRPDRSVLLYEYQSTRIGETAGPLGTGTAATVKVMILPVMSSWKKAGYRAFGLLGPCPAEVCQSRHATQKTSLQASQP